MPSKLSIIVGSTRPGRVGIMVGEWILQRAIQNGKFDVEFVDLAKINLPMYDEQKHPSLQQYAHEHTKKWAAMVSAADAYVFVTPEYNYGPPPALVNALNYVYKEWNFKPASFVSYGGVSGGTRAVQVEKLILTTLKVIPIFDAVVIPMAAQFFSEGRFNANEIHEQAATVMLNELFRFAEVLKPLRR